MARLRAHWTLSIGPGIALLAAGLLVARGGVGRARVGGLLALVAGFWLVVGPFLHGIWSSDSQPIAGEDWKRALLWVGWYVGIGAAAVGLASFALGLLARQRFAAGGTRVRGETGSRDGRAEKYRGDRRADSGCRASDTGLHVTLWSGRRLVRTDVTSRRITLGRPVDLLFDARLEQALGLEVLCLDGQCRFLPWLACRPSSETIEVSDPLSLLEAGEADYYRAKSVSLRRLRTPSGARVEDVDLDESGCAVAVHLRPVEASATVAS